MNVPGYDLLTTVGEGAYGEVHLARSPSGLLCAVKITYRNRVADADAFEREYRGVCAFRRLAPAPGLIRVLDVGRDDDAGFLYAVMETADDERTGRRIDPRNYRPATLAAILDAQVALPLKRCVAIAIVLARVLRHLQEHHLAHRDVKPGNVLLIGGRPVLADVGLVADMREIKSIVGTPGYSPPENHGTLQGDVYSLGHLLHRASTGRGADEAGFAPREEADAGAPGFAEWLAILRKACAERPAERYGSAKAMLADLLALRRKLRRRRLRPCLLVAAVLAAIPIWLRFVDSAPPPDEDLASIAAATSDEILSMLAEETAAETDAASLASRLHINPVFGHVQLDEAGIAAMPTLLKTTPYPTPRNWTDLMRSADDITPDEVDYPNPIHRVDPGPAYVEIERLRPLGKGNFTEWLDRWGYLEGGRYDDKWNPKADSPIDIASLWEVVGAAGTISNATVGLSIRLADGRYALMDGSRQVEAGAYATSSARSSAIFRPDGTDLTIPFFCWEEEGQLTLQGYSGRIVLRRGARRK